MRNIDLFQSCTLLIINKRKDQANADDSFKKLQVLKSMLDAGLISLNEYSIKREDVLLRI
jgi:hypothetical protein